MKQFAYYFQKFISVVCFATHEDLRRAMDKYQGGLFLFNLSVLNHFKIHYLSGKDINGRRIKLVDDTDGGGGFANGGTRRRFFFF